MALVTRTCRKPSDLLRQRSIETDQGSDSTHTHAQESGILNPLNWPEVMWSVLLSEFVGISHTNRRNTYTPTSRKANAKSLVDNDFEA